MAGQRDLSRSIIGRQLTSTILVMTMVEVADAITSIIDGLMTSRLLGPVELAACGLASPYFTVAMLVSAMLVASSQTLCTRSMSGGRMDEANRIFSLTCALALLFSGAMAALGVAFSGPIAVLLGARGDSAALLVPTREYLAGLFLGTPANVMIAVLVPILQLDGDSARANMVALAVGVGDVAGNFLFAVALNMGTFGFGLGTSFSYLLGMLVALSHFTRKDRMFRFRLSRADWRRAPGVLSAGLPTAVAKICRTFGPMLVNIILLSAGGTAAMTAMSVWSSIRYLFLAPGYGVGSAALTLGGMFAGEKDVGGLKVTVSLALRKLAAATAVSLVIVFFGAPLIARVFFPADASMRASAAAALRLLALAIPFKSLNMAISNYLQAVAPKRAAYFFNVSNELVFPVACAFAMSKAFGAAGVFASVALADALLLLAYATLAMLRKDCGYAGADKLLFLPKDFGIPEEDSVSLTVTSMEEVIGLSQRVQRFCEARGVDKRRAYLSALCIEEMAGNTVQYGFSDGKPHTIDIRAIKDGGDVHLRLRDDCARFDLKEQIAHWELDPEHPEENVGIRLILGMAKDVSYANTMRTNYLRITV